MSPREPGVHERSDGVEREDQQALYDRQKEERVTQIEERRVRLGHVEEPKSKTKTKSKESKKEVKKEETKEEPEA